MFTGSIVALVTPMNKDTSLDWMSLKKIINFHIESGTNAIVIAGTTGECFSLNEQEVYEIVIKSIEFSKNRIPIIVGTGSNNISNTIKLINKLKYQKISAFLSLTPSFCLPTQQGLIQYFKSITMYAKNIPYIIYNNPIRTGCDIFPETVCKLTKIKNIIGIKDATGDLTRISKINSLLNTKNFLFFSGDDKSYIDFMRLGGAGVISVTANIAARTMFQICKLIIQGNLTQAYELNKSLEKLHNILFIEPNPTIVKWACKRLGLINSCAIRLPMLLMQKKNIRLVEKAMLNANLI